MKRFLLFSLMQLFAFSMFAQTLESPLELPIGEVTAEGEATYFKYAAPEDKNVFLSITVSGWSTGISVSKDGTDETIVDGAQYNGSTYYPVNKGEEVIVFVSTWGDATTFNTAVIENTTIGGGLTCDDAVQATTEPFFLPAPWDYENYTSMPAYSTFTVPEGSEAGLLEMTFYSYPSTIMVYEGCDDTEGVMLEITDGDDYKNIASMKAEPGKTYIIQTTAYAPMMASFRFFVPEAGYSCAMPIEGKVGENTLPAAAGRYWYEVVMDKAGALVVSSEANLTGGYTRIYSACEDYNPTITADYLQARRAFTEAGSYFVYIEKATGTDAPETFTISVEDLKPYDSAETAELLTAGDYTTPMHNGIYYYTIKTPEAEGAYFIDVTPAKEFSNYETRMCIYPTSTMSVWEGGQEGTSIHLVAEADTEYLLEWYCYENINNIPFNVNIYQIEKGQIYDDPIQAALGENTLKQNKEVYYSYTASKNGWLLVDTDPDIEVSFPRGSSQRSGEHASTQIGTIRKIEVEAEMEYIIKFANVPENTTFELSEADYQQGESADNPFMIDENGVANIPAAAGKSYYKYVATKDGMMEINVNALSEYNYASGQSTQVSVTIDGSRNNVGSNNDGTYSGTYPVKNGSEVIVMVVLPSAQEDKTINISVRDLLPGESSSLPIVIEHNGEEFEYLFPEIRNRLNAKWYSIQLNPGTFKVATTQNYFSMDLYKSGNTDQKLATSTTNWDANPVMYELAFEVAEAGEYLLCLSYDYGEFDAAISGTALQSGAPEVVKPIAALSELSNGKAYTITNARTGWGADATGMKTTHDLGLTNDAADANQQFAILTSNKGKSYYLYSVGQSKFVGKKGALSDTPTDPIYFKAGEKDSTFVIYIDGDNYFNAGGSMQTSIDWWGTPDAGNSNHLLPVADFDAKAALALIEEVEKDKVYGVTSLDELSNDKAYYVQNTRGMWAYDPAYTVEGAVVGANMLVSSTCTGVATDLADVNKQFAFLKSKKGNFYLYSVAAKKFAVVSGDGIGLVDTPTTAANILNSKTGGQYAWVVALGENQIGISNNYTNVGGLITFYNDLGDAGNTVEFIEAGELDATEALAAIEAFENPAPEPTTVEADPASGKYDTIPTNITLTFSKEIKSVEYGILRTNNTGRRGLVLDESNYQLEGNVLKLTLPEDAVYNCPNAIVQVQVVDVDGNYVTSGDYEEYVTLTYEAAVKSNVFACVAITPEDGSTVSELSEFTLTFANPVSDMDFAAGTDATKQVVLKNAAGEVVANGKVVIDLEAFSLDVKVVLDKPVYEAGTYTLVVPEGTIYNSSYYPEAEDLGVEMGAIYNPEFTATFTVDGSLTGISAIIGNATSVKVYDVKGRLVGNSVKNLKKGVYVINGKKVMVK